MYKNIKSMLNLIRDESLLMSFQLLIINALVLVEMMSCKKGIVKTSFFIKKKSIMVAGLKKFVNELNISLL